MKKKYVVSWYGIGNATIKGKELGLIALPNTEKALVGRDMEEILYIKKGD